MASKEVAARVVVADEVASEAALVPWEAAAVLVVKE